MDKERQEGIGQYFYKNPYRRRRGNLLCIEDVIQIYAMLSCDVPVYQIGAHFGISSMMVYHIKNGTRWSWVRDHLLEETEDELTLHSWVPDVHRKGRFVCLDCGLRYDKIMNKTQCPVKKKELEKPIYLSWAPPPRKMAQRPKPVPAADLKKARKYKAGVAKAEQIDNDAERLRTAKRDIKELEERRRKERLLIEVEILRKREEIEEIERRKFSSQGRDPSAGVKPPPG